MLMCTHGPNQTRVQTRQADKNKLIQKKGTGWQKNKTGKLRHKRYKMKLAGLCAALHDEGKWKQVCR